MVRRETCRPVVKSILVSLAAMSFVAITRAQGAQQQPAPAPASQQPPSAPASQNAAYLLKALDQVIDENRKLAEQNQQLMIKVGELRQQVETTNPTIATVDAEKTAAQLSAEAEKDAAELSCRS